MYQTITGYAQQLYLFAEAGLEQAKLDGSHYWYIDGSLLEEYPKHWPEKRLETLCKRMEEYKIKALFHGNFKVPLSSDIQEVRESAIRYVFSEIDICSILKAPIILHGGAIVEPRLVLKAKRLSIDHYLRSLEVIAKYAEQKKVTILLENLSNYKHYRPFHYIFTTPEEYQYIFDRLDENVRFFFDIGHSAIGEGDPISVINDFSKKIWGMSFSNNDGVKDQHLGLYQGVINYFEVVKKIIEVEWKGVVAFEVRGKTFKQNIEELEEIFKKVNLKQNSLKERCW